MTINFNEFSVSGIEYGTAVEVNLRSVSPNSMLVMRGECECELACSALVLLLLLNVRHVAMLFRNKF